jgi:hypothetical protein
MKPQDYAARRTRLQLQCVRQREQFALRTAELSEGLHGLNRGLDRVRGSRIVPALMALVSVAGVASRAGGVVRLLGRVWMIVNTVQRLRRALK